MYTSRGLEMEDYIDDYWLGNLRLWSSTGKGIGFANGVFDLIHIDHIKVLNFAKSQCDILIVGINSDVSVKLIKGDNRPVINQYDRLAIVRNLKPVDLAFLFDEESPQKLVKRISPDVLIKGPDWRGKLPRSAKFAKRFVTAGHDIRMHSTDIIERIRGMEWN